MYVDLLTDYRFPLHSLTNNSIDAKGGVAIAKALEVSASLTSLNIQENKLSDEGGIAIGNALGVNATLASLDLCHNGLDDQTKAKLRSAAKSTLDLKGAGSACTQAIFKL